MFCRKCGTKLPDDSQFCPKCGLCVLETSTSRALPTGAGAAAAVAPALEPTPQVAVQHKITRMNRGVVLAVLLLTGTAYACVKTNAFFLTAFVIYVLGMVALEIWKLWLGFGIFRRLSGSNRIGIIYTLSTFLSFVPLLGWVACAVGNDMAGKAVAQKLGKKASNWIYFGWVGLYHLQGLLNEAAGAKRTTNSKELMHTPSGPATTIRGDVSRIAQDFLVSGLGATTSIITAVILVAIDLRFNFSLYSWMLWLVVPAGAFACGLAAASGYYLGARVFNHRPTTTLLLNMAAISIATFFLIHYLNYYFLVIDGKSVRDFIPFTQFLDFEISHTAVQFRFRGALPIGTPVEIGSLGYLYAALQVVGFAVGGVAVYFNLKSVAYCDTCSKYLVGKGIQTRYTADSKILKNAVQEIRQCLTEGRFQDAISAHARAAGNATVQKEIAFYSQIHIKQCKTCNRHWLKFTVSKWAKSEWKDITELGFERFCAEPISIVTLAGEGL